MQFRTHTYHFLTITGLVLALLASVLLVWSVEVEAWPGVTAQNVIVCRDKATYQQAVKMLMAEDWTAIARLIVAGRCADWDGGTAVEVEGISWGTVQVRRRGQVQTWWTAYEMIQSAQTKR
jgi:hypothetical protein